MPGLKKRALVYICNQLCTWPEEVDSGMCNLSCAGAWRSRSLVCVFYCVQGLKGVLREAMRVIPQYLAQLGNLYTKNNTFYINPVSIVYNMQLGAKPVIWISNNKQNWTYKRTSLVRQPSLLTTNPFYIKVLIWKLCFLKTKQLLVNLISNMCYEVMPTLFYQNNAFFLTQKLCLFPLTNLKNDVVMGWLGFHCFPFHLQLQFDWC